MESHPAVDPAAWDRVLAHRPAEERGRIAGRFRAAGVSVDLVQSVLADGGDRLYAAAAANPADPDWAEPFGGLLAVTLLAAEVGTLAAQLGRRASGIRALAAERLLENYSAVTVAAELGVSRQKIYEIARGGLRGAHLSRVPWRNHETDQ